MYKRNISGKDLSKVISSEDILGKEVIDLDGANIGVVERVLIDPEIMNFVGISIDKGFLRRGLTIGKDYILRISEHAVFLKIRVAYEIKGKIVFDKDGNRVGIVSGIDVYGNKNELKDIHIKTGVFRKELVVSAKHIRSIGDNVILTVAKKRFLEI